MCTLGGLAAVAPAARADGDPASDVLAVQKLFLPSDANVPFRQQQELNALLHQAARKHYPLRVAIITSPSDLGSVSALWRQPQNYARFLGSELALVFHGTVLVVMPNGYGTDVTAPGTRIASGETELPLPGNQPGSAAVAAVERLASSAGTPISPPDLSRPTAARSATTPAWLAFGLGFLPLAAAWAFSLRRRPVRLHLRSQ